MQGPVRGLNGHVVEGILDTGATISVISAQTLRSLKGEWNEDLAVKAGEGTIVQCVGTCNLLVKLGDWVIEQRLSVMKNCGTLCGLTKPYNVDHGHELFPVTNWSLLCAIRLQEKDYLRC